MTHETGHYEHRDPRESFETAIASGLLSDTPEADNYAGRFMYMGHQNGRAGFKHILTRKYHWDA